MLKKLFTHFLDAESLKIDLKFCVKFVCHLAFFSFYYYYGTLSYVGTETYTIWRAILRKEYRIVNTNLDLKVNSY